VAAIGEKWWRGGSGALPGGPWWHAGKWVVACSGSGNAGPTR
jgi:hypothetical protein